MVNLYPKALAIAALFTLQGLQAQVGISTNPNFIPHNDYALHIDGNLKVESGIKLTDSYGIAGQILKSSGPDTKPIWVDNPDIELPEGMLFIENTYTKLQQNGAENVINNRIAAIPTINPGEGYTYGATNGWQKIIEINNIVVSEPKTSINIDFQTGVTLSRSGGLSAGDFVQFACGVFMKEQNETIPRLKGYRLGQITTVENTDIKQTNFDLLYTIPLDPLTAIGTYDAFIACKKFNEFPRITGNNSNYELQIGSTNNLNQISLFTNQSVLKLDVSFKL